MALGAFFARLKQGLARSTQKLTEGIASIIRKRRLDDAALEELEELLISADLGPAVAARVIGSFRRTRFGKEVSEEEIRAALAEELSAILAPVAREMPIDPALKPQVVLVVGVNGTGKTTTIGKLAQVYREQGKRVVMVAGDTFRAAAVEQLQIWGQRTGCEVITGMPGADAAGLAFDALTRARAEGADLLLIDTAGRLHNKSALMEELRKIIRVLRKQDPSAPHSVLLVLDATTGQNALAAGAGVQGDGGCHRAGGDEAGWLGARGRGGGAGGEFRDSGARGGGGRAGRGFAAVRCGGVREGVGGGVGDG